jgi:hypothetical protein
MKNPAFEQIQARKVKATLADGVVEGARVQMIDATPPTISLSCCMTLREEFFDEMSVSLAAFGVGKV